MKSKSRMELGDITHHNLKQLKRLNQVVFPVSYNEKFYKDVLDAGDLAKLVYYNDIVVGAVCCRIDPGSGDGRKRLYIMTLGCLAPYRRLGLGTLMLQNVFDLCIKDPAITSIFLHVQVSNEDALSFYGKFGFKVVERMEGYYKRIEPADAFVLERKLDEDPIPQSSIVDPAHQNGICIAPAAGFGGITTPESKGPLSGSSLEVVASPPDTVGGCFSCARDAPAAEREDPGQGASASTSGTVINGKFSASLSKTIQPSVGTVEKNPASGGGGGVAVVNGIGGVDTTTGGEGAATATSSLSPGSLSNGALSPKQQSTAAGGGGGSQNSNASAPHATGKGKRKAKK